MDASSSTWSELQKWLHDATNSVEILPGEKKRGEKILQKLRISPRSLMGTIVLETGGVLIDHGWLRFWGSGNEQMKGDLLNWNLKGTGSSLQGAFLVAHDVIGGFFAMNGGMLPGEVGDIFYLAPDTLKWMNLHGSYSQLFSWAITGNIEQFYGDNRWSGWKEDVSKLNGDQGFSIAPFLWAQSSTPKAERSRRIVPLEELWNLEQDLAHQIQSLPLDTSLKIYLT